MERSGIAVWWSALLGKHYLTSFSLRSSLFCFCFFALGQGPGQAARRPLRPCRGARDGWPGPGRGAEGGGWGGLDVRCSSTADHGGPRGGCKREGAHARARRARGAGPTPPAKGCGGTAGSAPALNWDGGKRRSRHHRKGGPARAKHGRAGKPGMIGAT